MCSILGALLNAAALTVTVLTLSHKGKRKDAFIAMSLTSSDPTSGTNLPRSVKKTWLTGELKSPWRRQIRLSGSSYSQQFATSWQVLKQKPEFTVNTAVQWFHNLQHYSLKKCHFYWLSVFICYQVQTFCCTTLINKWGKNTSEAKVLLNLCRSHIWKKTENNLSAVSLLVC